MKNSKKKYADSLLPLSIEAADGIINTAVCNYEERQIRTLVKKVKKIRSSQHLTEEAQTNRLNELIAVAEKLPISEASRLQASTILQNAFTVAPYVISGQCDKNVMKNPEILKDPTSVDDIIRVSQGNTPKGNIEFPPPASETIFREDIIKPIIVPGSQVKPVSSKSEDRAHTYIDAENSPAVIQRVCGHLQIDFSKLTLQQGDIIQNMFAGFFVNQMPQREFGPDELDTFNTMNNELQRQYTNSFSELMNDMADYYGFPDINALREELVNKIKRK